MALALSLGSLGSMNLAALAFEETTVGGGQGKSPTAQVLELPKDATGPTKGLGDATKGLDDASKGLGDASKGLSLQTPELHLSPGTEVRIPGIGTVGVLPKLDFGLELLYGQNEQKGPFTDKSSPDDVQLRGTIKHRF